MKTVKKAILSTFLFSFSLLLVTCFSPWTGEEQGTLTVSFGGTARLSVDSDDQKTMVHEIILTGPGPTQTRTITGIEDDVSFTGLANGTWTVTVWGRNPVIPDNTDYQTAFAPLAPGELFLRAWGQRTLTIPNVNTATVSMIPATEVSNEAQLSAAITNARTGGLETIIIVAGNITTYERFIIGTGRNISMVTRNPASLTGLATNGSFFTVSANATLYLGRDGFTSNLIISGNDDETDPNNQPLVNANGTLVMNNGIRITGNHHRNTQGNSRGGAVIVPGIASHFIMNGGTISGNSAVSGGGVVVDASGTFTMNGGTIGGAGALGNTADRGGGVYVSSGTFEMRGGAIITGNKSTGTSLTDGGGGVAVDSAGQFNMINGTISGNEANAGGGVASLGIFNLSSGNISSNGAATMGGAVIIAGGDFTMSGGTIGGLGDLRNTANSGGGVYLAGTSIFTMSNGNIKGNNAGYDGGGVFIGITDEFSMSNGTISENKADDDGGGVYIMGDFTLSGGTITGNIADYGGGLYLNGGTLDIIPPATPGPTGSVRNNTSDSPLQNENVGMLLGTITHNSFPIDSQYENGW